MPGNLSFNQLKRDVQNGEIDTVLVCLIDMQGRLMGKRFYAQSFIDSAWQETHCCDYLLATDFEMTPVDGYAATSWSGGYGDYTMKPDLTTLRRAPWLDRTALVLCDVLDHHTHQEVPHAPRAILKKQLARLKKKNLTAMMATELEFFLFKDSYEELRAQGYRNMAPISGYNEDYHIFQTSKEEDVMRAIRNGLAGAGIPVEGSKGEAEAGQEEINIRYSSALETADHHAITKNACKEIAWQKGRGLTFLAKWHHDRVGSSSHVHQSLQDAKGKNAFYDPKASHGMSKLMRAYLAGLIKYAKEGTYFLAPYVNSYKRFAVGTFAPTKAVWSIDNRTAGFRLCGQSTQAVRTECRIGGADLNPYLALAAQLAAGLAGIEENLKLGEPLTGNAYATRRGQDLPKNLLQARNALSRSKMFADAFGADVIKHYLRTADWELEEYNRVVTDWEVARGFERT
ncbi:MAG: glutamine synthetase family protein [Pseudomonadota bacterium]